MEVYPVTVGPLTVVKVTGAELAPGDIITLPNTHQAIVLRSYSLDHLSLQCLDVETGELDDHGDFRSPYRHQVSVKAEFIIYRAGVVEKRCRECGAFRAAHEPGFRMHPFKG